MKNPLWYLFSNSESSLISGKCKETKEKWQAAKWECSLWSIVSAALNHGTPACLLTHSSRHTSWSHFYLYTIFVYTNPNLKFLFSSYLFLWEKNLCVKMEVPYNPVKQQDPTAMIQNQRYYKDFTTNKKHLIKINHVYISKYTEYFLRPICCNKIIFTDTQYQNRYSMTHMVDPNYHIFVRTHSIF